MSPRFVTRRRLLESAVLVVGGSLLAACAAPNVGPPSTGGAGVPTSPPAANATTPPPAAAPTSAPAVQTGAGAPVTIGAVMPLTGRYASLAAQVKNGYDLAFEDLNKDSKIQLQLKVLDDGSDPTNTVQHIESLNASDSPLAFLGGAGSDLHAAAAAVADKNKTPYVAVAFALYSVHQRGLKYLFSPFPKSPQLATAVFDMMDGLSPKPAKVAIFAEKSDWGAEMDGLWQQEAKTRGGYEIVADEQYTTGATDYSALILKAKGSNADAVLALPSPPDGMALTKQMKELDFMPKLAYLIRAPDGLVWAQNLGNDGNWIVFAPGWHPDMKFPGVQQVVQEHQSRFGKPAEVLVGPAYAAVQILFDAVKRAGKADRDALRDALAATDMTTVVGPVKFNPDGTAQVITVMDQWLGGKQVLIWPKDQAGQAIDYPAKPWSGR